MAACTVADAASDAVHIGLARDVRSIEDGSWRTREDAWVIEEDPSGTNDSPAVCATAEDGAVQETCEMVGQARPACGSSCRRKKLNPQRRHVAEMLKEG